jgi:hypothetical protein
VPIIAKREPSVRKPFIISSVTKKPLTDLQARKRAKLLIKSKTYREFLRRTRRQKKRTAGQRKVLPKAFGLFTRYASLADPEIALLTEALERLDDGLGKPHEQLMLELEIWSKSHRALLSATRKLTKPRP